MDEAHLDRSIRFAAFLIGGVLFLAFGLESLVPGLIGVAVDCGASNSDQFCSGSQLWQSLAVPISGSILTLIGVVFFVLAYRARRSGVATFPSPP